MVVPDQINDSNRYGVTIIYGVTITYDWIFMAILTKFSLLIRNSFRFSMIHHSTGIISENFGLSFDRICSIISRLNSGIFRIFELSKCYWNLNSFEMISWELNTENPTFLDLRRRLGKGHDGTNFSQNFHIF